MPRALNGLTISSPASDPAILEQGTFTFTVTPAFAGSGTVTAYDLSFNYDQATASWTAIPASNGGLTTANTNPLSNLTTDQATSITVKGVTAAQYSIRVNNSSRTIVSGTKTVTVYDVTKTGSAAVTARAATAATGRKGARGTVTALLATAATAATVRKGARATAAVTGIATTTASGEAGSPEAYSGSAAVAATAVTAVTARRGAVATVALVGVGAVLATGHKLARGVAALAATAVTAATGRKGAQALATVSGATTTAVTGLAAEMEARTGTAAITATATLALAAVKAASVQVQITATACTSAFSSSAILPALPSDPPRQILGAPFGSALGSAFGG